VPCWPRSTTAASWPRRALGSSQPTLGRHIAELETQLGVVLSERTGRGLRPTAMAARLAESARPEIRTDRRIRAVYDFLARNIPASI
jgi:DNA-binding transcriptional LysR family regulator